MQNLKPLTHTGARVRTSQFRERSWSDPDSWTIEGESENQAVPHRERVPCEYDAVVFPKGWRSAPCSVDTFSISIESFTFGSQLLDNDDLKTLSRGAVNEKHLRLSILSYFLISFLGIFDYVPFMTITWQSCKDKSGCICGNDMATEGVCASRNFEEPNNCIDAIRPIGFCADICGASILFHYNHKFSLDAVRRSIRRYDSDTYASKVRKDNGVVIQVVFTEKEFTGASLDEAKQFYDELLTDKSLGAVDVELHSSSRYISKANVAGSAVGLVFGTLIAVLAVFGVIFFVYSPKGEQLRLRERFRLPSRPLSFKTNLLARFDNSETAGLIIGEAASLSGSVQSLNSSFDNPMYGKAAPSVSAPGTSYDTEVNGKLRATTSEISVENPMYDLNKDLTDAIIEAVAEEEVAALLDYVVYYYFISIKLMKVDRDQAKMGIEKKNTYYIHLMVSRRPARQGRKEGVPHGKNFSNACCRDK
ncbi:hypothetical protein NQ317_004612 [Molorchus minor]|uniref:Protein amnionless n=1 Tax=Molorchus minor TaxID=1323400 RepID=A0ABQ9J5V7_9CUCU|nr:hypothetical protein NQ317_004612 [Molorchus minor]